MTEESRREERISFESYIGRYDRQLRTENWGIEQQRKLYNSRVLLIGSDILGQMTLGCLVCLGVGEILVMDKREKRKGEKGFLANNRRKKEGIEDIITTVKKINSHISIRGINSKFSESFLDYYNFNPDVIIETTNDLSSKERALEYSIRRKIGFISSYCNHKKSILAVYNSKREDLEGITNSEGIIDEDPEQGSVTAGINAGMMTDELRKFLFGLNDRDKNLAKRVFYNLDSSTRISLDSNIRRRIGDVGDARVLVVGAGAIGNYVALNLALSGFRNVDIVDHDTVKDSNLNRQILFYAAVGRGKAQVLSERIKEIGKVRSKAFGEKITEESENFFKKNRYDLIFGCLDNFEARYYLNKFAVEFKIPYIDGGTSDLSGNLAIYSPGNTACIGCKKNLRPEPIQRSCGDALPSVVIPNIIVGSAMVGEGVNILRGQILEKRFVYDSFGQNRIYFQEEPSPKEGCLCLN